MNPLKKLSSVHLGVFSSLIIVCFLLGCGGCGQSPPIDYQAACRQAITDADKLYADGKAGEAVAKYEFAYTMTGDRKGEIVCRIIEHHVATGNEAEARGWIDRSIGDGIGVVCKNRDANELVLTVRKERAARALKAHQVREAAAEQSRKAIEENRVAAEKAKQDAYEASRPKVSRLNYHKVAIGMSLSEVQEILGPGKEAASGPGVLIATWQSGGLFPTVISITFVDGRVESKAIIGD